MTRNKYIGMCVGKSSEVVISEQSANEAVAIVGLSGTGKSVRMREIEMKIVENGGTVVAIDLNGTHYKVEDCNYFNVMEDGIGIQLLTRTPEIMDNQTVRKNMVAYAADVLSAGQGFGPRQKIALRKAIEFALENDYLPEMEGIREGLLIQEKDRYADSVLDRLWNILEGDYFKVGKEPIKENMLNIISLKGINPSTQKILVEIFLSALWKKQRQEGVEDAKPLTVALDEFQMLNFGKGAILAELLTESRKYKFNLILATQTLARFNKTQLALLDQAATKLFFQPAKSDVLTIAKMIDRSNEKYWCNILENLKVGQAVATGELKSLSTNRGLKKGLLTVSEYKPITNEEMNTVVERLENTHPVPNAEAC